MRYFLLTLLGAFMLIAPAAHAISDQDKAEMGDVIRQYLLDNPGVLIEAMEKYRINEEIALQQKTQGFLDSNYAALTAANLPSYGNPDGEVVIVEFFDYNCGYCKRALPDIINLTQKNEDVRVVFHELPILGPTSHVASKWAMAAHEQGKYFDFHAALMKHSGGKDEAAMERIAKQLKLDVKKMKADVDSKKIAIALADSKKQAEALGISGTPAFIVGDQIFRGYIGAQGLSQAIATARKGP